MNKCELLADLDRASHIARRARITARIVLPLSLFNLGGACTEGYRRWLWYPLTAVVVLMLARVFTDMFRVHRIHRKYGI